MDAQFWLQRWQQGKIGFHQQEIHDRLQELWPAVAGHDRGRVFVPLCGKSLDMLWLAQQGFEVIGVELSPLAVAAFFFENGLDARQVTDEAGLRLWQARGFRLYCGDFFQLPTDALDGVNRVYDRAALVALPAAMRRRYAETLVALLPRHAEIFLVTLEYDSRRMDGPPFSVDEAEVRRLFQDHYRIECLDDREVIADSPHLQERGIDSLREKIWWLRS